MWSKNNYIFYVLEGKKVWHASDGAYAATASLDGTVGIVKLNVKISTGLPCIPLVLKPANWKINDVYCVSFTPGLDCKPGS